MGLTIEEYNISSIVLDGGSYRDHWAVGVGGLGFLVDSKGQKSLAVGKDKRAPLLVA
jgi:hypothetical protein